MAQKKKKRRMTLRLTAVAAAVIVCGGAWSVWRILPHSSFDAVSGNAAGNKAEAPEDGNFSHGHADQKPDAAPPSGDFPFIDGDTPTGDGASGDATSPSAGTSGDPWTLPDALSSGDLTPETLSVLGRHWLAQFLRRQENWTAIPAMPLCDAVRSGEYEVTKEEGTLRVTFPASAFAGYLPEGDDPEAYLAELTALPALVTGIPLGTDGRTELGDMYDLPIAEVTVESQNEMLTLVLRPEKSVIFTGTHQYLILCFRDGAGLRDCLGVWLSPDH